jgi:hypothetical protein
MTRLKRIPQGDKVSMSTGLIYGGQPTPNADDTKFDLAESKYRWVQRTSDGNTVVQDLILPEVTAGTSPDIGSQTSSLLIIDPSDTADPLKFEFLTLTELERSSKIELGGLIHVNNVNITAGVTTSTLVTAVANQVHNRYDVTSFSILSGNDVLPKAGVVQMSKDIGMGQARGRNNENLTDGWLNADSVTLDALTTITFIQLVGDGTPHTVSATIDPNLWDDGSSTPQTIANPDEATIARIYGFPDNSQLWMFGQMKYSTFSAAQTAEGSEMFIEPAIISTAIHLYSVIVLKTATDATDLAEFELRKKF